MRLGSNPNDKRAALAVRCVATVSLLLAHVHEQNDVGHLLFAAVAAALLLFGDRVDLLLARTVGE